LKAEHSPGLTRWELHQALPIEAARRAHPLVYQRCIEAGGAGERCYGLAASYEAFRSVLYDEASRVLGVELSAEPPCSLEDRHTIASARPSKRDGQSGNAGSYDSDVTHASCL
jgi:hypothetical protein